MMTFRYWLPASVSACLLRRGLERSRIKHYVCGRMRRSYRDPRDRECTYCQTSIYTFQLSISHSGKEFLLFSARLLYHLAVHEYD